MFPGAEQKNSGLCHNHYSNFTLHDICLTACTNVQMWDKVCVFGLLAAHLKCPLLKDPCHRFILMWLLRCKSSSLQLMLGYLLLQHCVDFLLKYYLVLYPVTRVLTSCRQSFLKYEMPFYSSFPDASFSSSECFLFLWFLFSCCT